MSFPVDLMVKWINRSTFCFNCYKWKAILLFGKVLVWVFLNEKQRMYAEFILRKWFLGKGVGGLRRPIGKAGGPIQSASMTGHCCGHRHVSGAAERTSTWSTQDLKSGVFVPVLVKDAPGVFTLMFSKDHMSELLGTPTPQQRSPVERRHLVKLKQGTLGWHSSRQDQKKVDSKSLRWHIKVAKAILSSMNRFSSTVLGTDQS